MTISTSTSTPPSPSPELDAYQERLLSELRAVVAERAADGGDTPTARESTPRTRWLRRAGIAAAAAVLGVAAMLADFGGDPAYAVAEQANGDIRVTIHELADADGLEQALAAEGIKADVSYDPSPVDISFGDPPSGAVDGSGSDAEPAAGGEGDLSVDEAQQACGFDGDRPPLMVTKEGSDFVFTIPAGTDFGDGVLSITTSQPQDGAADSVMLTAGWVPADGNADCGMAQVGS